MVAHFLLNAFIGIIGLVSTVITWLHLRPIIRFTLHFGLFGTTKYIMLILGGCSYLHGLHLGSTFGKKNIFMEDINKNKKFILVSKFLFLADLSHQEMVMLYANGWETCWNAGGRTCPCDRCYCDPSVSCIVSFNLRGKLICFASDTFFVLFSSGLLASLGTNHWNVLSSFLIWGRLGGKILFSQHRQCLGCAVRFGAGPESTQHVTVKFCLTNPTCLMNKTDTYRDLTASCGCHYIAMSETAATQHMQNDFAKSMRHQGLKVQWGVPVPPFRQTTTGKETHRGKASGVGLMSKNANSKSQIRCSIPMGSIHQIRALCLSGWSHPVSNCCAVR